MFQITYNVFWKINNDKMSIPVKILFFFIKITSLFLTFIFDSEAHKELNEFYYHYYSHNNLLLPVTDTSE